MQRIASLCSGISGVAAACVGDLDLAAQAIKAGLVDEIHLSVAPIVVGCGVGGGTQSLPENVRLKLELMNERRCGSGVVYLRYRTTT